MQNTPIAHQRVLDCAYIDIDTLYKDFHIPQQGYNEKQAEESRIKYGRNLLSGRASDTSLYRLRRAFINPFTIILFVLAAVSFLTDVVLASNFSRNITTAVIILCMLLFSGIVRFIQEMRAKRIADHLTQIVSSTILVLRNDKWLRISSEELVVGDKVRLFAGERVPADIRLTWAKDLFVSQSVLTGESAILEKNSDTLVYGQAQSYSDYYNIAFMGSSITGGTGEGIVLAVGKETVYGGFSAAESRPKNGFDQGANSIAWVLIRFMAVLIPIVFIACGLTKGDWLSAFLFALSVAVGLTPEMLPMVISACLAKGSAAMGKKQTVVKNINAMQGFGSMDVLCVDKTGTLTGDKITLEYYMDVLGNECQYALDLAYLNSLYHTGVQNHLDDAILRYREIPEQMMHYEKLEQRHPKLDELPFDHERRYASVLVRHGKDNLLIIKGSVEEVYQKCSYIEYKSKRQKIDIHGYASVHAIVDEMLEDGMKVLAVAYKTMEQETLSPENENGLTLLGYLAFFDAPKQSAADAIEKLQKLHVDVRVLTGDNQDTAVSICRRLGIDTSHTLTGAQLEQLTDNEISVKLEHTTVFSELSPKQKVEIVQTLRANGHTVGFLGDGMNDLPAIVESDVGISVDTAAETVKEAADVILLKKDLNVLEEGIQEGRRAFANVSKYIKITASSNFGNIFSIVIASVFLPFFPMTALQLLLLNLLYDILCLVLPWDKVDDEVCSKPLEWSGKTLGRFMRFFGPISSIFDIVTFAYLFFVLCPSSSSNTKHPPAAKPSIPPSNAGYCAWHCTFYYYYIHPNGRVDRPDCAAICIFYIFSGYRFLLPAVGHISQTLVYLALPRITLRKDGSTMKKNIGFISLDSSLVKWLREALRTSAPQTSSAKELMDGFRDLMDGTAGSLMLELEEGEFLTAESDIISCGTLSIDFRLRRVSRNGQEIALTPKEFDILCFLARNRGEVFTKEQIYQAVWENDYLLDDSNIMAFIRKLRKKIEPNPDSPEYILTIWGIGYKFNDRL